MPATSPLVSTWRRRPSHGLITYRAEATSRVYRLNEERLREVQQWMQAQLDICRERFDRLDAHLDRMKKQEESDGEG
jgi:DNA-binding PadR family transcriptional regulator